MARQITLIPGDGIGPEVAQATIDMVAATGLAIDWDTQQAGVVAVEACGKALPDATLASIERTGLALKGPTTTPIGTGHVSANVGMRRALSLYASVRPVRSLPGIKTRYENVDLVIFRENTEGLYAGLEQTITPGVVVSMKVVTEAATRRIATAAFEFAQKNGRKKVTIVHKANILKLGDGLFLKICKEVGQGYPGIQTEECIVDALCMRMVSNPCQFDVLLMENLYGDIISDLCAGLVGGLGVVGGANLGSRCAIFEAVHGAAPDIAGKGIANPTALTKSAVMMLEHMGELKAAEKLNKGLDQVLAKGEVRTGDLGGKATTRQFTEAVIAAIKSL
jgi:isocitrate dehydrogenase (NAD+)